jgi:hypothetical protein
MNKKFRIGLGGEAYALRHATLSFFSGTLAASGGLVGHTRTNLYSDGVI